MSETHAINNLEKTHFLYERDQTYIVLEDAEFRWTVNQVEEFDRMWQEGYSLQHIATHFDRTCLETGLLLMDRAEKGFCKQRKYGIN
ncbi:MAG: hypothetical protein ACQET8_23085 [Bacillota bacterium]